MVIDDLKEDYSELRAPDQFGAFSQIDGEKSNGFLDRLKSADHKSKKILQRFYIAYFSIAALYFALFILNPDPDLKLSDRINGTLLFIGIMLFAILAQRNYLKLNRIRYDQHTAAFLRDALDRYKFWTTEMNYLLVGVLIINAGSCRSYVLHYQQFDNTFFDILFFQIIFFALMTLGLSLGFRQWRIHKKSIYIEINSLLKDEI